MSRPRHFLYLPLLPQVAAGILEPRRVTVSLSDTLPRVRLVLGEADGIDLDGRTVHYADPESGVGTLPCDRLVVAVGSVDKLLPGPGVAKASGSAPDATPGSAEAPGPAPDPARRSDRPATLAEDDS